MQCRYHAHRLYCFSRESRSCAIRVSHMVAARVRSSIDSSRFALCCGKSPWLSDATCMHYEDWEKK